jgi:hypothetical protein
MTKKTRNRSDKKTTEGQKKVRRKGRQGIQKEEERSSKVTNRIEDRRISKGPRDQRGYPEGETGRRSSRLRAIFGYPSRLSVQHEAVHMLFGKLATAGLIAKLLTNDDIKVLHLCLYDYKFKKPERPPSLRVWSRSVN